MATSRFPSISTYRAWTVFSEGAIAGIIGGLSVMAIFLAYDSALGVPLLTPSVLHAYFWEGPEAASGAAAEQSRAFGYVWLHLAVWLVIGIAAAVAATWVDTSRRAWFVVVAAAGAALVSLGFLTRFLEIPGIGRHHLWLGACAGGIMLGLYLGRRHPHLFEPLP